MAQAPKRKELLQDLPPEERKRRLVSLADAKGFNIGQSSQKIIDDYIAQLPADEQEKWHVCWYENKTEATLIPKSMGYVVCKVKRGTKMEPVVFKGDILMQIPQEVYQKRLELQGAEARNMEFEKEIEETDATAKFGETSDDEE